MKVLNKWRTRIFYEFTQLAKEEQYHLAFT
ncbi:hypothetical protein SAMN05421786_105100 [Chryseobacterium ureilyticum]|uniref:Uncharacterized protein n=1 Tax=Chryseobacterium ureilyticum TaxID=373668 RepID=A0A1N7PE33_9FLAO|nr:hypothetical protein SAMN05421786_105100 [Chryseobacterium ureilyticum]